MSITLTKLFITEINLVKVNLIDSIEQLLHSLCEK